MELYLPRSKADRTGLGKTYRVPALQQLCPVEACQQWLEASGLTHGALFRPLNRWGGLASRAFISTAYCPVAGSFARAGLAMPDCYSSHSLRRGFGNLGLQRGLGHQGVDGICGLEGFKISPAVCRKQRTV